MVIATLCDVMMDGLSASMLEKLIEEKVDSD
jgi:hypothetical protein